MKIHEKILMDRQGLEKYGPITTADTIDDMTFTWINNPWPWEKEAN